MIDDARIAELRRRVHADPASIVFAQLAEECRRAGNTEEAVAICRAGLAHHPNYLTARVTLGRALIELEQLDDAFAELTFVLAAAPDHLVAIRALAEIYQRRGMMREALVHYRRALDIAQYDTGLSKTVRQIEDAVAPAAPTPPAPATIEELFDFDALLAQLDSKPGPEPPPRPVSAPAPSPLDTSMPPADDGFADLERQLREREDLKLAETQDEGRGDDDERRRALALQELEEWLAAITDTRRSRPSA